MRGVRIRVALLVAAAVASAQQPQDGPMLGFEGATIEADEAAAFGVPSGVIVNEVPAGSPAEAAGLKRDEVIVEVAGERLVGFEQVALAGGALGIGGELKVTVLRGKERVPISWKLQARSEHLKMIGLRAPVPRADGWVGGEAPTREKLAGHVVAVVMWLNQLQNAADVEKMFLSWHEAYGGKGLVVVPLHTIFVSAEGRTVSATEVVKNLEAKKFPMPVGHGTGERFFLPGAGVAVPLAVTDYRVQMIPAVVLVDKEGKIAARWEGEAVGKGEEAQKKIEELLAK